MKMARRLNLLLTCGVLFALAACNGGGMTATTPPTTAATASPTTPTSPSPPPSPGQAQTVTPAAYVQAMCTAVVDFQTTIVEKAQALQGVPTDAPPEQGVEVARTLLNDLAVASDTLFQQLQAAGVPEGSEDFASLMLQGAQGMQEAVQGALAELDQVPLDDPTAFQAALQALGDRLGQAINNAFAPVANLQDPELDAAFRADPACAELSSTG